MRGIGFWIGAALGLGLVVTTVVTERAPVRAAAPPAAAVAAAEAGRVHAFAPRGRAAVRTQLPAQGAAYLSMVAGGAAVGAPAVAAVREHGKLRLVQAGDSLDGAVVASIATDRLTLRSARRVVVMPRAR